MPEKIRQWVGVPLIVGIALYAFITENWWIFVVGDGLLLLIGAIDWLRRQGEDRFGKPSQ